MSVFDEFISDPEIKAYIDEGEALAILYGFKNYNELAGFKYDASQGMIHFGGSFLKSLGQALVHADTRNGAKIVTSFSSECRDHANIWRTFMAKRDAELDKEEKLS